VVEELLDPPVNLAIIAWMLSQIPIICTIALASVAKSLLWSVMVVQIKALEIGAAGTVVVTVVMAGKGHLLS